MSKSKEIVHVYQTRKNGTAVLVIPKPIRTELGINSGDEFIVRKEGDDKIIYRRLSGNRRTVRAS